MLAHRADRNLRQLRGALSRTIVVMWFDNFYRLRFCHNPVSVGTSLNTTVMAMLRVPTMQSGHRWPTVQELLACSQRLVQWLATAFVDMEDPVHRLAAHPLTPDQFPVHLDHPCSSVRSVQWSTFDLATGCPGHGGAGASAAVLEPVGADAPGVWA